MVSISLVDKQRKIYLIIIRALNEAGYCIKKTQRQNQIEIIEVEGKGQTEDKKLLLEQAIEELENFFISSNESQLYKFILAQVEKPLIENVLDKTEGNQLKAAKILGINRNTLHSKIKKLGIEVKRWKKY